MNDKGTIAVHSEDKECDTWRSNGLSYDGLSIKYQYHIHTLILWTFSRSWPEVTRGMSVHPVARTGARTRTDGQCTCMSVKTPTRDEPNLVYVTHVHPQWHAQAQARTR